jgi:hypothetical protein
MDASGNTYDEAGQNRPEVSCPTRDRMTVILLIHDCYQYSWQAP